MALCISRENISCVEVLIVGDDKGYVSYHLLVMPLNAE